MKLFIKVGGSGGANQRQQIPKEVLEEIAKRGVGTAGGGRRLLRRTRSGGGGSGNAGSTGRRGRAHRQQSMNGSCRASQDFFFGDGTDTDDNNCNKNHQSFSSSSSTLNSSFSTDISNPAAVVAGEDNSASKRRSSMPMSPASPGSERSRSRSRSRSGRHKSPGGSRRRKSIKNQHFSLDDFLDAVDVVVQKRKRHPTSSAKDSTKKNSDCDNEKKDDAAGGSSGAAAEKKNFPVLPSSEATSMMPVPPLSPRLDVEATMAQPRNSDYYADASSPSSSLRPPPQRRLSIGQQNAELMGEVVDAYEKLMIDFDD